MLEGIRVASKGFVGRALLAVVMGLIVLSFVIFGVGDIFRGFGSGKVAQVGSTEITSEQLRFAYQTDLQRLQRRFGRTVTNEQARLFGLDQQVLGRLISEAAMDSKAHGLGLAMSDAALAREISSDPAFKDAAGRFDPARFQELLRDNGFNERTFVRQQRGVYLRQEIAEAVAGKVAAPQVLLAAVHRYRNETRSIDYFVLPPAASDAIAAPTDDALARWFESRRASFAAPELRKITTLALTPTTLARADDVSDADATRLYDDVKDARFTTPEKRQVRQIVFPNEAEARAAAEKIKSGTSFDEIMAERKLSAADVDLGLVTKAGISTPAVANAAFALSEGAVSEPVKTSFGAALVQVTKTVPAETQPFTAVSAALKNEIARDRAKKEVRTLHDKIEDARASGKSLTETARTLGLQARTLDGIDSGGRDKDGNTVEGLTAAPELLKAAFASDIGVDNETIATPDDGYVWFEVGGIEPAHERSLAEVRDRVIAGWQSDEADKRLGEKATAIIKELGAGGDLAKVAEANGQTVKHEGSVKRTGAADLPSEALQPIFQEPKGGVGSVAVAGGRLIFHVLDEVVPDFDPDKPEVKTLAEQMSTAVEQDILQQFVGKVEADIGVRVNAAAVRTAVGGGGGGSEEP